MPARRYPPGPSSLTAMRGLRALGGSSDLSGVPVFLADVTRRYGGIAHWKFLNTHFFLLDDPALIEDALVAKGGDFKKGRGIQRLKRLLGEGLLSSEQPLHLRQRRLLQPAFHRERIAGYGRQMVAATLDHIAGWQVGHTTAIDEEMTRLTLSIATRTLFSTSVADDSGAIRATLTTLMRTFPATMSPLSQVLEALPILPATRRFNRARAQLDAVIYEIIAARRRDPSGAPDDLLGMLLTTRDASGALDDVQARDEAMTLFLAGHETTANALAWTWYELARQPAIAERLRAELDAVLGDRAPDPADLPKLTYTRDVFAETLRLYPPAWILGRRALRDTTVGTQVVPRGSVLLASQLVTQRNPRYWPQPDVFRPERWNDGSRPTAKFAYFPFGGGNRLCIGESFAWMEGVLLIATIAQRFTITAVDDVSIPLEPLITLRPGAPVRVRLGARTQLAV